MEKRAALIILLFLSWNLSGLDRGFPVAEDSYFSLGIDRPILPNGPNAPFEGETGAVLRFYPPLEGGSGQVLTLSIPENMPEILYFLTDRGRIPAALSFLPEGTLLFCRIPDGMAVQGIAYDGDIPALGNQLALKPEEIPDTGLSIDLASPDILQYRLPRVLAQKQGVLSLNVRILKDLTITGPEETDLVMKARETSQRVSFVNHSGSSVWTVAPLDGIKEISFAIEALPEFPVPLPGNLSDVLNTLPENWRNRDFELYRWNDFPHILIWDCFNYDVQNRFFRRLSYFVEKKGFRGTLMSNGELENLHGWNAHDYRPEDLADFYNLAEKEEFPLYKEEWLMRDILVSNGLLNRDDGGGLLPGEGAVISISRESPAILRKRFLVHEASHGLYFTSAAYRDFIAEMWEGLSEEDRRMWRFYLGWYGYDPGDEDLMVNEFQAYLVQQRADEAAEYFDVRLKNLIGLYPGQKSLLENGTGGNSEKYSLWSGLIGHWLRDRWGIESGDFFRLYKDLQ